MKLALALVLAAATAAHADPKPTAEQAATAWLKQVRAADGALTASKGKPLAFWLESKSVDACWGGAAYKDVTATTDADAKQIRACIHDQLGSIGGDLAGEATTAAKAMRGYSDKKHKAAFTAAAKGGAVIEYAFNGDGEVLILDVIVAKDGAIKAAALRGDASE
jgi:hypothetical protein